MASRKRIVAILVGLVFITVFGTALMSTRASAQPTMSTVPVEHPEQAVRAPLAWLRETEPPPPPEQDTCQHCHLAGSIDNMWTPVWRWMFFGALGLVTLYGGYRAGSVWILRKPWKPLLARTVDWFDERYQVVEPIKKVLSKPVPLFATRWIYCLGGITFLLFIIQGVTGTLLAFYYKPTPEQAYTSIQFIETQVRFGASIRAIHHWSANGMVVMVVAHMLRVFITGAFKPPRELNWVTGIVLLVLTLGFGFTGYLLPWDQRAFWATTVGTEIGGGIPQIGDLVLVFLRGGWDVTAVTLSRFYALHILVFPALILILLLGHFIMIRRQGIARPL
jgi:hypothetical protein